MTADHIKNTIQNGLSALLRACRPGRLVLVCRAMEKELPKKHGCFLEGLGAAISGSNNIISSPIFPRHLEKDRNESGLFFSNPLSFFPRAKVTYIRSTP